MPSSTPPAPRLAMSTGVAATIKRKGGGLIEEEAVRQGPIEVGEAVLTPGGNLPATHVIHAAAVGPDLKTDAETVARTTRAVLALADKHRLTSLALPALGTGAGQVAPAAAAEAMLERRHHAPEVLENSTETGGLHPVPGRDVPCLYRYVEKARYVTVKVLHGSGETRAANGPAARRPPRRRGPRHRSPASPGARRSEGKGGQARLGAGSPGRHQRRAADRLPVAAVRHPLHHAGQPRRRRRDAAARPAPHRQEVRGAAGQAHRRHPDARDVRPHQRVRARRHRLHDQPPDLAGGCPPGGHPEGARPSLRRRASRSRP